MLLPFFVMQSFQERFKYKSSTIGKTGEVDIKHNRAIIKPDQSQIHSPIIKTSAKSIIESQNRASYEKSSNLKSPSSASPEPKRKISSPKRQVSQAPPLSFMGPLDDAPLFIKKNLDFVPYTITDYSFIKPNKYYELGGLGPSSIGTDDWTKRKKISEKRKNYSKKVAGTQRDNTITDSAIEYAEKFKSNSVAHTRNSTSLT